MATAAAKREAARELERHPNRSAAGILWTGGGLRPIPVLRDLSRELRCEADGYRPGRHPSRSRTRELKHAARAADVLRRCLEKLDTISDD